MKIFIFHFICRDWNDYKNGFGDMQSANGEFWLGNDNLYYLTSQGELFLHSFRFLARILLNIHFIGILLKHLVFCR